MADRTPQWPDRTIRVPPPSAGSWPDANHAWPAPADPWPDAGAWPDNSPASGYRQAGAAPGGPPPTSAAPGGAAPSGAGAIPRAYNRGVAQVGSPGAQPRSYQGHDETRGDTPIWRGAPDGLAGVPRPPMRYQLRQLRRGGEWTMIGGLFGFICWGIWAISVRAGDLTVPVLAFVLVVLIAAGVFALSRLLGKIILERGMGRTRRSAWPSHLITGLFLAASGVAYLKQTEWVVDAWGWLSNLG
ncbi:MAG TPA: hypothetical protein VFR67_03670 [Pilimelia sp.]|nr:hypothetical protein [Pilimelia sp.]